MQEKFREAVGLQKLSLSLWMIEVLHRIGGQSTGEPRDSGQGVPASAGQDIIRVLG